MLHPMLAFLIQNLNEVPETQAGWLELAERFNISPDQKNERYRAENTRKIWRRYFGSERGVEVKSIQLKDGEEISRRVGLAADDRKPDLSGAKWYKHTTSPNGGGWTKYANGEGYGLTNDQASEVAEKLQGLKFDPPIRASPNGTGIVDFSDLHTGAVLKYAIETVKTLPFDLEILTAYIDEAVEMVNAYGFEKLYVFLPGDVVETFTAFNHRDSWKNIQYFQGGVTIVAYQVLRRLLENLENVQAVYIVEGNHDRLTSDKEGNSRKGIAEVLSFFLQENSGLNVNYHPFLISAEIDGVFHLCTHGDYKPFNKNDFWFRYGKQGIYNVLRTGHFHGFNVLRHTNENLHYQCPSMFTGNFFSESIGFDAVPGITIVTHHDGLPRIDYRPLASVRKNIPR